MGVINKELAAYVAKRERGNARISKGVTAHHKNKKQEKAAEDLKKAKRTRSVTIDGLGTRPREMCRLALLGHTNGEIALKMGVPISTVSAALKKKAAQDYLRTMSDKRDERTIALADPIERVPRLSHLGLDYFEQILSGEVEVSDKTKLEVAKTMVDRAIPKAASAPSAGRNGGILTNADITDLVERGKQLKQIQSAQTGDYKIIQPKGENSSGN